MDEKWGLGLGLGTVEILAGLWLLSFPGIASVVLTQMIGILWLALGTINVIEAINSPSGRSRVWLTVSGILGLAAGLFVIGNPFLGALTTLFGLTLTIAVIGIAMGLLNMVRAFESGGVSSFILGIFASLVGVLLLLNPIAAVISLPTFLGILALGAGVVTISYALRSRYERGEEIEVGMVGQKGGESGGDEENKEEEKRKEAKRPNKE